MKKIAVYFHGFGSSSQTDKVQRLREAGIETHAWDIDVDSTASLPTLIDHIDNMLIDHMHEPCEIFFVGTSLGAWYAARLAHLYDVKAILINPSYNPKESLAKYGVDQKILNTYYDAIDFAPHQKIFIGSEDKVIDFTCVDFKGAVVSYVEGADHRFNKEFDLVIKYIMEK